MTRERSRALPQALTTGLLVVVILEMAAVAIRYALQIVLARLAGPHEYGVYTFALTWAQMLAIPAGLGISGVVIRYIPQYQAQARELTLRSLLTWSRRVTVCAGAAIAGVGALVISVIRPEDADVLYLALVSTPLLALSTLFTESLRGGGRLFASRIVPTVLQPTLVIGASLAVYLMAGSLGGLGAMSAMVVATAVGVVIQGLAIRTTVGSGLRRGYRAAREWLGLGLQLLLVKVFQMVLNLSDILLVGVLVGPTAAGFYAVASKTVVLASLFTQAVNLAVPASVSKAHHQGDVASVEAQLRWSAKLAFLPSALLAAILMVFPDLVLRAFGPEFVDASGALVILAVGRLVSSFTGPVGSVLSVTGHQRVNVWTYGLAAGLQVVLDLLLIPTFGIVGAAIANSVAVVFWNVTLYVFVIRLLPLRLWPLSLHRTDQES